MPNYKKRDKDLLVAANHYPPVKVMQHCIILVLADSIVGMQMHHRLTQAMIHKEMV